MFINDRQKEIITLIKQEKYIKIKTLCRIFNASEPTIRKDLQQLDQVGKVIYVRGGAHYPEKPQNDIPKNIREQVMEKEKKIIAQQVVQDLLSNQVIFLDTSTTTTIIARELSKYTLTLTIITNSFEIVSILYPQANIDIIFCGGTVDKQNYMCSGVKMLDDIQNYHADIAILSCHGIMKNKGFVNGNLETAQIKKHMIQNADSTWVCVDHSKFNRNGIVTVCTLDKINRLYTDTISTEWQEILNKYDCRIVAGKFI